MHCHSRRGADVLGGLAASFADIPTVVSRRVDNTEMRLMAALRYRPFKKVIAISKRSPRYCWNHGVEEERIVVIRDAVDVDAFDDRPRLRGISARILAGRRMISSSRPRAS